MFREFAITNRTVKPQVLYDISFMAFWATPENDWVREFSGMDDADSIKSKFDRFPRYRVRAITGGLIGYFGDA